MKLMKGENKQKLTIFMLCLSQKQKTLAFLLFSLIIYNFKLFFLWKKLVCLYLSKKSEALPNLFKFEIGLGTKFKDIKVNTCSICLIRLTQSALCLWKFLIYPLPLCCMVWNGKNKLVRRKRLCVCAYVLNIITPIWITQTHKSIEQVSFDINNCMAVKQK